jgi:hypothetical protein
MKRLIILLSGVFSKKSAPFKDFVFVFTCLVLLSILGCVAVIKDNLPQGTPKGYVKFYRLRSDPGNLCPMIYSVDEKNKELALEGKIPSDTIWVDRSILQLAKTPGNYHFIVRFGTGEKVVRVRIVEGMVTPVRIIFGDVKKTRESGLIRTTFNMDISVEAPIPLREDKS